jgi:phosphoribosyl 1,2-cyclic phosphate phosphodiesterase
MRVTFLGSGTSTGVPVVGCHCPVCTSDNPKNHRLRQSVKIETKEKIFLIDTTPDLRTQLLRCPTSRIDFILFTHAHADHLMGLDDIRPYNFFQKQAITGFANSKTAGGIRRAFSYIWDNHAQAGGGKPQLDLHEVEAPFTHQDIDIIPIPVRHGDWTVLGYRIGPFAYITDTNGIPESSQKLLEGIDTLALDGLRVGPPHSTHFIISEAIEAAHQIGPRQTYLIHLSHDVDHDVVEASLPSSVRLAYDGLTLEFP